MAEGRLSVGNVEIVALNDGEVDFAFLLTQTFPSTTEESWAQYRQR
ncbi:MAG TPA: hypothetical protein VFA32_23700 [Dehalococcoidia bacterium]|jgi:hypothetical protein|nr:hypothetical protein [Dehalococcoidia bacterium]